MIITLKTLASIVLIFLTIFCYGQNKDDIEDSLLFAHIPSVQISLAAAVPVNKASLPFKAVKVIDARYDTALRYMPGPKKIAFVQPLQKEIEKYIKENYQLTNIADSAPALVILIDKLWISSSFETANEEGRGNSVDGQGSMENIQNTQEAAFAIVKNALVIKANVLSETNSGYHPFYSVDTFFVTEKSLTQSTDAEIISHGINSMLDRIVNKPAEALKISCKILLPDDINNYISNKFSIPILTASAYPKGVFKTFDEVKNNQPSIRNFEVVKTKKTDVLYVKDSGATSYPLRDFWGYSDGINLYINKGYNFFRLFKQTNTFVFNGFNAYTARVRKKSPVGSIIARNALDVITAPNIAVLVPEAIIDNAAATNYKNVMGKKSVLEIDMETGKAQ